MLVYDEKAVEGRKTTTRASRHAAVCCVLRPNTQNVPFFLSSYLPRQKRKALFNSFDPNGNGYLSLAEVDLGVRKALDSDALFDAKPAIMRAFQVKKQPKINTFILPLNTYKTTY